MGKKVGTSIILSTIMVNLKKKKEGEKGSSYSRCKGWGTWDVVEISLKSEKEAGTGQGLGLLGGLGYRIPLSYGVLSGLGLGVRVSLG